MLDDGATWHVGIYLCIGFLYIWWPKILPVFLDKNIYKGEFSVFLYVCSEMNIWIWLLKKIRNLRSEFSALPYLHITNRPHNGTKFLIFGYFPLYQNAPKISKMLWRNWRLQEKWQSPLPLLKFVHKICYKRNKWLSSTLLTVRRELHVRPLLCLICLLLELV